MRYPVTVPETQGMSIDMYMEMKTYLTGLNCLKRRYAAEIVLRMADSKGDQAWKASLN